MSDAIAAHADAHGAHAAHHPDLQHHFDSLEQQHEAATLGMWLFLITEVLFFGGLFLAYMLYRVWYPVAWAEASRELDITLGAFNTAVLIGSSLTMAFAVRSAQTGKQRATFRRKLWRKLGRDEDGQSVGRHWDDAGQIQNPREFVKYPVKPGDLETILRDGGPGLRGLRGRLIQPRQVGRPHRVPNSRSPASPRPGTM